MKAVQAREAKETFSALIDAAAHSRRTTIIRDGRLGFLTGEIDIPSDFDDMGRKEIEQRFAG